MDSSEELMTREDYERYEKQKEEDEKSKKIDEDEDEDEDEMSDVRLAGGYGGCP